MLRQLRKPRRQEPPDAQHLQAARHDVISERMLSLSPRQAPHTNSALLSSNSNVRNNTESAQHTCAEAYLRLLAYAPVLLQTCRPTSTTHRGLCPYDTCHAAGPRRSGRRSSALLVHGGGPLWHPVAYQTPVTLSPRLFTCRSQAQREEEQSAALREMGPEYLEEGYDSVAAELARLPPGFDAGVLDGIVDRRSWVLEVRGWRRNIKNRTTERTTSGRC
jgi:hypothetical protein